MVSIDLKEIKFSLDFTENALPSSDTSKKCNRRTTGASSDGFWEPAFPPASAPRPGKHCIEAGDGQDHLHTANEDRVLVKTAAVCLERNAHFDRKC